MPKSLVKNYGFNLLKTISGLMFPLVTFVYASRILGVDGIGQVNFAKSFVVFFANFAVLGMNYYGTREAAKLRDDKEALSKFSQEMLIINAVATALSYGLLFALIACVPLLQDYLVLLLINSIAIVLQGMGMEWLYQGLEEYRYIAVRSVVFQLIALVALVVFVRSSQDVVAYTVVLLIASSGSYVLNFLNARKYISFHRFSGYRIRCHLRPLLWLFFLTFSIELYTVLDTTMLGFLKGDEAVGLYSAAIKICRAANQVITATGIVLIPRLAYWIAKGEWDLVESLVRKAYNFTFLLSIPLAMGIFLFSDVFITLFGGSKFAHAAFTLQLLAPIVIVIPFSMATNQQTLVPLGKETLIVKATLTAAAINFTCNLLLIPPLSENGAAIATSLAESVVAIVSFLNARKFFSMRQVFKGYWSYWLAASPIVLLAWAFRMITPISLLSMLLTIACATPTYFFILYKLNNPYFNEGCRILRAKVRS